jgi:hypothetical protein
MCACVCVCVDLYVHLGGESDEGVGAMGSVSPANSWAPPPTGGLECDGLEGDDRDLAVVVKHLRSENVLRENLQNYLSTHTHTHTHTHQNTFAARMFCVAKSHCERPANPIPWAVN